MLLIILFALFNQVSPTPPNPCTIWGPDRCVQIKNNCPLSIWPAVSMQVGNQTTYDGEHEDYHFPNNVTYLQVWARTKCNTLGGFECITGDCGPNIQCDGDYNVSLPITVAEIWPNRNGFENFDVTLFNGFNLPITITPTIINSPKLPDLIKCRKLGGCDYILNDISVCPVELRFIVDEIVEGCYHPCTIFKTPEYCCTGEYASPQKCLSTPNAVAYRALFKDACPATIMSPFDTPVGTCGGVGPLHFFYTITFC